MIHHTRHDVENGHDRNFERLAVIGAPGDCWEWSGPHSRDGYGLSSAKNHSGRSTQTGAHRVSYILHRGDIPEGLVIDHLCRNRGCVNPAHMEAVTNAENLARRPPAQVPDFCFRGHPMSKSDARSRVINGRTTYSCAECARQAVARYRARQKADRAA